MDQNKSICLLNDSFPPQLDGVSNAIVNYAGILNKNHQHAFVVTPEFPEKQDEKYAFPVIRYPSIDLRNKVGYMGGFPFSPKVLSRIKEQDPEIIHCHCPAASLVFSREMRPVVDAPLILTYHTKFEYDIRTLLKSEMLSQQAIKIMLSNISGCDEVWAVSRGAGESLQALGYQGDFLVMPNGVDMALGRSSDEDIAEATAGHDLPERVPVFLTVGRMFWYKGHRITIDALEGLKSQGFDFRMVFIGGGMQLDEIRDYTREKRIADKCIFTGPVYDRRLLKAWYTRADLFLFPSTYDTNGLVVREAASCYTPSVLVAGSCAAEGAIDEENSFLISETAASMAVKLARICQDPEKMKKVGEKAAEELYISWEQAVAMAYERYGIVLDNYRAGRYPKHGKLSDRFFDDQGEWMDRLSRLLQMRPDFFSRTGFMKNGFRR